MTGQKGVKRSVQHTTISPLPGAGRPAGKNPFIRHRQKPEQDKSQRNFPAFPPKTHHSDFLGNDQRGIYSKRNSISFDVLRSHKCLYLPILTRSRTYLRCTYLSNT